MWDDFLSGQIRRTNRNRIALGAVLLAALGIVLGVYRREAYNFFFGPFPVNAAELGKVSSLQQTQKYFIRVRAENVLQAGMREVSSRGGAKEVVASYFLLPAGRRLLLVRSPRETPQAEYKGTLVAMPPQVLDAVLRSAQDEAPALRKALLPVLLDAELSPRDDWILGAVGVVCFLVGAFFLLSGLQRTLQPEQHPVRKTLARYGDPTNVALQIENELRNAANADVFGKLRMTANWVIFAGPFDLKLTQLNDLVWAYQKIVKHYHTFIPVGKSYSVILRDRAGQTIEVQAKKNSAPAILTSIERRAPWVVSGFSRDIETAWQKQRNELVAAVDQRRASLASGTSSNSKTDSRDEKRDPVLVR